MVDGYSESPTFQNKLVSKSKVKEKKDENKQSYS